MEGVFVGGRLARTLSNCSGNRFRESPSELGATAMLRYLGLAIHMNKLYDNVH